MNDDIPLTLHSFPRAVLHIDGDAFFASCEQARDPQLQGKPVITGKERGIARPVDHASPAKNQIEGFRRSSDWNECHPEPREHEPARLHAASLPGRGPESDC